jgi:hypothetical protein
MANLSMSIYNLWADISLLLLNLSTRRQLGSLLGIERSWGCHLVPGHQTTLRALPALARWMDLTKKCNIDQYLNPVRI